MTSFLDEIDLSGASLVSQRNLNTANVAQAMRTGKSWRCGKIAGMTDSSLCIQRRDEARAAGNIFSLCHDCTIPLAIKKPTQNDTPAGAPMPVVRQAEGNSMGKRAACIDCKRVMAIISGGRCGTCYNKFRRGESVIPPPDAPALPSPAIQVQPATPPQTPVTAESFDRPFVVAGFTFEPPAPRLPSPEKVMVHFHNSGNISFNRAAGVHFDLTWFSYIRMYPSTHRRALGLKFLTEQWPGSTKLTPDGGSIQRLKRTYRTILPLLPEIKGKRFAIEATEMDGFFIVRLDNAKR